MNKLLKLFAVTILLEKRHLLLRNRRETYPSLDVVLPLENQDFQLFNEIAVVFEQPCAVGADIASVYVTIVIAVGVNQVAFAVSLAFIDEHPEAGDLILLVIHLNHEDNRIRWHGLWHGFR